MKILDSKILVLHMFSITGSFALTWVEELPAITKWKSFLYHSIQFYIAIQQTWKCQIANRQRDWASHPVCVFGYPERNLRKINTKAESYHWKLCYLAWNKCCSTTLQEIISRIEIVESMAAVTACADNTEADPQPPDYVSSYIGNRNVYWVRLRGVQNHVTFMNFGSFAVSRQWVMTNACQCVHVEFCIYAVTTQYYLQHVR